MHLDLAAAPGFGLSPAQVDRLRLSPSTIESMPLGWRKVVALPEPIGEVIESSIRPNGLEVLKVRVPLGVVFFIYESRPNVTADAAAICLKSGNAVILRRRQGGGELEPRHRRPAGRSGRRRRVAGRRRAIGFDDRSRGGGAFSCARRIYQRRNSARRRRVDSPRRGRGQDARHKTLYRQLPPLCRRGGRSRHGERILINGKCQRMGVCNALESLLVHGQVADKFLPRAGKQLSQRGIEIRGDQRTRKLIADATEATPRRLRRGIPGADYFGSGCRFVGRCHRTY